MLRVIAWGNWAGAVITFLDSLNRPTRAQCTCLLGLKWYLIKHLSQFPRQTLLVCCEECFTDATTHHIPIEDVGDIFPPEEFCERRWIAVLTNTGNFRVHLNKQTLALSCIQLILYFLLHLKIQPKKKKAVHKLIKLKFCFCCCMTIFIWINSTKYMNGKYVSQQN